MHNVYYALIPVLCWLYCIVKERYISVHSPEGGATPPDASTLFWRGQYHAKAKGSGWNFTNSGYSEGARGAQPPAPVWAPPPWL